MKIKNLVKLSLGVITAGFLLSGCGATDNQKLNVVNNIVMDKSLSKNEQNNILTYMIGDSLYMISNPIEYQMETSSGKYSRMGNATLKYFFNLTQDGLIIQNHSYCPSADCSSLSELWKVKEFEKEVSSKKQYIENNFNLYQKEYSVNKQEILTWIDKVSSIRLKPDLSLDLSLPEDYINGLKNNSNYIRKTLIPEKIFVEYKNSKESNLSTFLNNYNFLQFNPNQIIYYKDIQIGNSHYTKNTIDLNLSNINSLGKLNPKIVFSTFYPDKYIIQNKEILLELRKYRIDEFQVKIINLTNKFIDINTVSIYLDNAINSISLIKRLPPNGETLESNLSIKIPAGVSPYIELKDLNSKRNLGAAVSYKIDNKEDTLYKEDKISFHK